MFDDLINDKKELEKRKKEELKERQTKFYRLWTKSFAGIRPETTKVEENK